MNQVLFTKYINSAQGKHLLSNYFIDRVGTWQVRGPANNYLATYQGSLDSVIRAAVQLRGFWQSGTKCLIKEMRCETGFILPIEILQVPTSVLPENPKLIALQEDDGWIWYDAEGKDFGPFEFKEQAQTVGRAHSKRAKRLLLDQKKLDIPGLNFPENLKRKLYWDEMY